MAHMNTTYPKDMPQVKEGRLQQNLQQHVHPELRRQVPLGHPPKKGAVLGKVGEMGSMEDLHTFGW